MVTAPTAPAEETLSKGRPHRPPPSSPPPPRPPRGPACHLTSDGQHAEDRLKPENSVRI